MCGFFTQEEGPRGGSGPDPPHPSFHPAVKTNGHRDSLAAAAGPSAPSEWCMARAGRSRKGLPAVGHVSVQALPSGKQICSARTGRREASPLLMCPLPPTGSPASHLPSATDFLPPPCRRWSWKERGLLSPTSGMTPRLSPCCVCGASFLITPFASPVFLLTTVCFSLHCSFFLFAFCFY